MTILTGGRTPVINGGACWKRSNSERRCQEPANLLRVTFRGNILTSEIVVGEDKVPSLSHSFDGIGYKLSLQLSSEQLETYGCSQGSGPTFSRPAYTGCSQGLYFAHFSVVILCWLDLLIIITFTIFCFTFWPSVLRPRELDQVTSWNKTRLAGKTTV